MDISLDDLTDLELKFEMRPSCLYVYEYLSHICCQKHEINLVVCNSVLETKHHQTMLQGKRNPATLQL